MAHQCHLMQHWVLAVAPIQRHLAMLGFQTAKALRNYQPPNLKLLNPTEIVSSITIFVGPKLFKRQHLVL